MYSDGMFSYALVENLCDVMFVGLCAAVAIQIVRRRGEGKGSHEWPASQEPFAFSPTDCIHVSFLPTPRARDYAASLTSQYRHMQGWRSEEIYSSDCLSARIPQSLNTATLHHSPRNRKNETVGTTPKHCTRRQCYQDAAHGQHGSPLKVKWKQALLMFLD
jgi:hypothetical protein